MSGVRFAAMIPATRATASTSPLGRLPATIRSRTSSPMVTCATATARRLLTGLSPTSIMRISDIARSLRALGLAVPAVLQLEVPVCCKAVLETRSSR